MSSQSIATLAAVKNAIRHPYSWPGGYPLYILMVDGEPLSIQAAHKNWASIVRATLGNDRSGWEALDVGVNWEDSELFCADSGCRIESAYAEESAYQP